MKRTALLALLSLAACSGSEEAADSEDPSKLSAELEARASEIETRADEAVAEVEREAQAELAQLRIEAANEDAAEEDAADEPTGGDAPALPEPVAKR